MPEQLTTTPEAAEANAHTEYLRGLAVIREHARRMTEELERMLTAAKTARAARASARPAA
jgi:hypothetical protein